MEIGREGLRVRQTDATRDVLARAATASTDDDAFSSYAEASTVPFRILRRACEIARRDAPVERREGIAHPRTDGGGEGGGGGPWLQDVVRGGGVELVAPSRPPRSRTLDAEIARLRRDAHDREYAAMTRDVSHSGGFGFGAHERTRTKDDGRLRMSALTRDLGFGAHVVTVMFACALGGWFAGDAIVRGDDDESARNAIVKASLAGIGAIGAMTVEALLFMLRDSRT